jgi:hypothetical protein
MHVLRCWGIPEFAGHPHSTFLEGKFLEDVNWDGPNKDGNGTTKFTKTAEFAKKFEFPGDALEYLQTVPKRKPFRDDGLPNKPLTAYHWEVVPLEEVIAADVQTGSAT